MKIDAECVLADGKEVRIAVDLDYVETISDVYDYINNEPEALGSYVAELKNEDEIEAVMKNEVVFNKALDTLARENS